MSKKLPHVLGTKQTWIVAQVLTPDGKIVDVPKGVYDAFPTESKRLVEKTLTLADVFKQDAAHTASIGVYGVSEGDE